jgi:hypothetical protein
MYTKFWRQEIILEDNIKMDLKQIGYEMGNNSNKS